MKNKWILPGILLIIIFSVVVGAIIFINNKINKSISPLQQMSAELGTQVSNILHPTPTILPDPVTIINQVQSIARLETVHYTVEKIITAETNQGVFAPLFGDRLLFVAHGYVIAGLDMSKIQSEDLWLQGSDLYIRLPQTEILVYSLDNQKSYVYDRQTGLLTHGTITLETQARQVAEQEILDAALSDGILEQAAINSQTYLTLFLSNLGYSNIHFVPPEK